MNQKKIVAHRGDNTNYPENSYAGIKSALDAGALFIEFDIQMNADQSLVVIHDSNFKRTGNDRRFLFDTDDSDMSNISVHEPEKFGERYYPTYVSTLNEIMELISHFPHAHAFIEVKKESIQHWGLETVMHPLLQILKHYESQSTIISFSLDALEYTKQHSPLKIGFVFHDYQTANLKIANTLQPDYMIISQTILPSNKLWKGDWKWIIYSINNTLEAHKMLVREDIGLIETDNITLLLRRD